MCVSCAFYSLFFSAYLFCLSLVLFVCLFLAFCLLREKTCVVLSGLEKGEAETMWDRSSD